MSMSVPEAARHLGVSSPRVMQMIERGDVEAELVSNRWIVDPASLPVRRRPRGRPMSDRVAWALLLDDFSWLRADEAYRLRRREQQWRHSPDPLPQLRAWLASRGEVRYLSAPDPQKLLADARVVPSGTSDRRAGVSAASFAEAYVHHDDAEAVVQDHLLVPAPRSRANVVLRSVPVPVPEPAPLLAVIADLADSDRPREYERARELLDSWVRSREADQR